MGVLPSVGLCHLVEGLFGTLSQLFSDETRSPDLGVEVELLLHIQLKNGLNIESKSKSPVEKVLQTPNVAIEELSSMRMARGDHLWEINDGDFLFWRDHEVELVEVAVDQPVLSQLYHQLN